MQKLFKKSSFLFSAILGFIFLIPFLALEFANRVWKFNEDFPFVLFILLWIHQTLFVFILTQLLRQHKSHKIIHLLRMLALALLAYVWFGILGDQWPCFMGVPNCD